MLINIRYFEASCFNIIKFFTIFFLSKQYLREILRYNLLIIYIGYWILLAGLL